MRAAVFGHAKCSDKDAHPPSKCDDDPPRPAPLGAIQNHIRHNPVAQQNQNRSADQLGQKYVHVESPSLNP